MTQGDGDRRSLGDDPAAVLFDQLGELVGARKDRGEVDRVLDRLAGKVADAGTRELRDRLVLALARGERRAGGRLGSGAGATDLELAWSWT